MILFKRNSLEAHLDALTGRETRDNNGLRLTWLTLQITFLIVLAVVPLAFSLLGNLSNRLLAWGTDRFLQRIADQL